MIEDFIIKLERPDMYMLGDLPLFNPWIWHCSFTINGKRKIAAFLQDSDARNPKQAAREFEKALKRELKRGPSH